MLNPEQVAAMNGASYEQKLTEAIEYAKGLIAKGVNYYSATEQANEEYGVCLSDIQTRVERA